jgi:hypothetical protein
MIRFLIRLVALVLLAGGFAVAVVDGTRSITADALVFTSTGDFATILAPNRFARLEPALTRINPLLWKPVAVDLLMVPAALTLAFLGLLLLWLVRRRPKPIGFSSRP